MFERLRRRDGRDGDRLADLVGGAAGPVLLVHDGSCADLVEALAGPRVTVLAAGRRPAQPRTGSPRRWGAVVQVASDVASLRRVATVLPRLGRSATVGCRLVRADRPLTLVPPVDWPALVGLDARLTEDAGAVTVTQWDRPVPAQQVLLELARAAAPSRRGRGRGGVVLATTVPALERVPPVDPGLVLLDSVAAAGDPALVVPPDVVLAEGPAASPADPLPEHPVTGRAPVVTATVDPVGPLDEALLNPRGFDPGADREALELAADGRLRTDDGGVAGSVDLDAGVTPLQVAGLRPHLGVRLGPDAARSPATARVVAGLAMAGVPVATADPAALPAGLGPRLREALLATVELAEPLRREEHSVRLRRAALLEHSTPAWRARLAEVAGPARVPLPRCSVLLATRRPERLDLALAQVAKQREVDLELSLVTHGFEADADAVAERLGDRPVTVTAMPPTALFGDVLNAGLRVCSGDVVAKMDDDDWYGPHFLLDLMLTRLYSAADLVGTTAEFVYLEELDRTVRRSDESERPAKFVAGGTLVVDRGLLHELGGFRRVRRFVDASLLDAVLAAGGTIYRGHGLGYVLRRGASGHTWEAAAEYFLDSGRLAGQWPGFAPSTELEHAPEEAPRGVGARG